MLEYGIPFAGVRQGNRGIQGAMVAGGSSAEFYNENGMWVGGPEKILATIRSFEVMGIDQVVTCPACCGSCRLGCEVDLLGAPLGMQSQDQSPIGSQSGVIAGRKP